MADAQSLAEHRAWLPAIEIIGVILLLVPRVRMAGMVVLLAVYGFAAIHAIHMGHVPLDLLLFAGTAVFIAQLPAFPSPGDGSTRGSGISQLCRRHAAPGFLEALAQLARADCARDARGPIRNSGSAP